MKLTVFSSKTYPKSSFGAKDIPPRITFAKHSAIILNSPATRLLAVKPGEGVCVAQDPEAPENWYIYKDKEGYTLRSHRRNGKEALIFIHASLRRAIIENLQLDTAKTYSFLLAKEPTEVHGKTLFGILITGE